MISIASFLSNVESREKKVKHENERGIMGESKRGQRRWEGEIRNGNRGSREMVVKGTMLLL